MEEEAAGIRRPGGARPRRRRPRRESAAWRRAATTRDRRPDGGAGGRSAGGRGPGGGGGRKGGPGAGLASRSSAGEQANCGRQRPALIAAPPRGAAPARAPLAPRPRQWAPSGPWPRPPDRPRGSSKGGRAAGGLRVRGRRLGGLWGARGEIGLGAGSGRMRKKS